MQQAVKANSTFNTADLSQKGYPRLDTQTPRAHPELFLGKGGGGSDPEAIYKICLILKSML